ncbi:MAG: OmpA family protein [Geobacter sp.]|nr:OmpA family protein [Geobacter sp.]
MRIFLIFILFIAMAVNAYANPSESGSTGLITVPSAETLDAGNICVGLWGVFSKYPSEYREFTSSGSAGKTKSMTTLMPITLTLGVGTFWEFYGSYPNLLFNGEEDASLRTDGTRDPSRVRPAEIGSKIRFWGTRNTPFKLAADIFARRWLSDDVEVDGTTDYGGRLIATLKKGSIGLHVNGGYLFPGNIEGREFDKEILYGTGIEYAPSSRTKVTLEFTGNTSREKGGVDSKLALAGFQYYLSPHLTFNVAGGMGFSDGSPDWRGIIGFSSCQGVGTYIKPVPVVGKKTEHAEVKEEKVKPVKIIPISSLLVKAAKPVTPVSKLEVPVSPGTEEVIIKPYGQIAVTQQQQTQQTQAARPVLPPVLKIEEPPLQSPEIASVEQLQERPLTRLGEEVYIVPKDVAAAGQVEQEAAAQGVSPLFALEIKGEKLVTFSAGKAGVPKQMTVYRKFRFPDVAYEFGKWDISRQGREYLAEIAEQIRSDKKWVFLRVDGHTDNLGSATYNMDLSLKRAIAVATHLVTVEGIDPARIFIKGMGKSEPIADNGTTDGRAQNRRSEILFLIPKESK